VLKSVLIASRYSCNANTATIDCKSTYGIITAFGISQFGTRSHFDHVSAHTISEKVTVFIPFHWVFGGQEGKKRKKRKEKGRDCGKSSTFSLPYIDFTACGCVKLLRCNPQIVFLILKRLFCWVYGTLGSSIFT
jgi:hypothetical protein